MPRAFLILLFTLPLWAQQQFQFSTQNKKFTSSTGFRGVTIADFNNDGKPDLVFTDMVTYGIYILLNDGNGNFTEAPGSRFHAGSAPFIVAAADFNNDGNMDIAVLNHFTEPLLNLHSSYSLFFGDGTGRFTPGPVQVTSSIATTLITGDFNKDGNADLALGEQDGVTVLLGQGDGKFLLAQNLFGSFVNSIASADFNKDGLPDLAVFSDAPATSNLYLGTGNGQTAIGPLIPKGTAVFALVGDWNNDGIPDLASFGKGGMDILLGDGKGSFRFNANFPEPVSVVSSGVADFDGDGNLDIVLISSDGPEILAGDGTGKFRPTHSLPAVQFNNFVFAMDVNGDGKPDVISADGTIYLNPLPSIPLNPRSLEFHATPGQSSTPPIAVATGQILSLTAVSSQPWLHYNAGLVTADATTLTPGVYHADLRFTAPGYFGTAEHVTLNVSAPSTVLTKAFTVPLPAQGRSVYPPTLANFNGDDSPDLLVLTLSSPTGSLSLNDGHGNFGAPRKFPLLDTMYSLGKTAAADFNGDGNLDVLVVTGPSVALYFGDGKGNLRAIIYLLNPTC